MRSRVLTLVLLSLLFLSPALSHYETNHNQQSVSQIKENHLNFLKNLDTDENGFVSDQEAVMASTMESNDFGYLDFHVDVANNAVEREIEIERDGSESPLTKWRSVQEEFDTAFGSFNLNYVKLIARDNAVRVSLIDEYTGDPLQDSLEVSLEIGGEEKFSGQAGFVTGWNVDQDQLEHPVELKVGDTYVATELYGMADVLARGAVDEEEETVNHTSGDNPALGENFTVQEGDEITFGDNIGTFQVERIDEAVWILPSPSTSSSTDRKGIVSKMDIDFDGHSMLVHVLEMNAEQGTARMMVEKEPIYDRDFDLTNFSVGKTGDRGLMVRYTVEYKGDASKLPEGEIQYSSYELEEPVLFDDEPLAREDLHFNQDNQVYYGIADLSEPGLGPRFGESVTVEFMDGSETVSLEPDEPAIQGASIDIAEKDGLYVEFSTNAESRNIIDDIYWDLNGDNQYEETGRSVSKTFSSGGNKEIKLKVSDGQETATASKTIELEGRDTSGYTVRRAEGITDYLGGVIDGVGGKTEIKFGNNLQNSVFVEKVEGDYIQNVQVALATEKGGPTFNQNYDNMVKGVQKEFSSGVYSIHLCHKDVDHGKVSLAISKQEGSSGYVTCFNDERATNQTFEERDYQLGEVANVSKGTALVFGPENKDRLYVNGFTEWDNIDRASLDAYANKIVDSKQVVPVRGTNMNSYFYSGELNVYFCSYDRQNKEGGVAITREDVTLEHACKAETIKEPSGTISIPSSRYPVESNVPVTYSINQRGKYLIHASLDGKNLEKHEITEGDAQEGTVNISLGQPGNLTVELIAPGTWWNPLDNHKTVSRADSEIIQTHKILDIGFETDSIGPQSIYLRTNVEARGGIDSIEWDLNNDNQYERTGRSINHTFETGGEKEVTIKAVAGDSVERLTKTISVESRQPDNLKVIDSCGFSREDYNAAGINAEGPRLTATLSDSVHGYQEVDIFWRANGRDIGERGGVQPGSALPAVEPNTEILGPGTYSLTAFARAGSGDYVDNQSCGSLTIDGLNIQPEIEIMTESIELNEQVTLRGHPENDYRYSWDLNNDNQYERNGIEVSTEYSSPGEKTARLRIEARNQSFEAERSFMVEQPRTSSSLSLNKEELTSGERLEIRYEVSPDIAENGYRVVLRDPSGEKIRDISKSSVSGSEIFVPDRESRKGSYKAELIAEEGFLSDIMRSIFGPEQEKHFEVISASENLDVWREHCQENGFDPLSSSGRASCISQEIGPECFKENPGTECREIANSVCKYYLDTEFDPSVGKCGE